LRQAQEATRERKGARAAEINAAPARAALTSRINSARSSFDQGLSRKAEAQLTDIIKAASHDETLLAQARCLFAAARVMGGHFNDSLAAIRMYESPEARRALDTETDLRVRVRTSTPLCAMRRRLARTPNAARSTMRWRASIAASTSTASRATTL